MCVWGGGGVERQKDKQIEETEITAFNNGILKILES